MMLIVGGAVCVWMALAQMAISTAPAAPSMWPVAPLVELTASFFAWSPKTVLMAWVSQMSPCGVEVPWALMYWMSVRFRPALRNAAFMQRAAPSPPGAGAVMWLASAVLPYH